MPNPRLLLETILLQEAKTSFEIENIHTTNDDLCQNIVADKKFDNLAVKEALKVILYSYTMVLIDIG
ncbi:MAG: Fic/DOC family N-terminal domain-containing protein [Maribacter sp.]